MRKQTRKKRKKNPLPPTPENIRRWVYRITQKGIIDSSVSQVMSWISSEDKIKEQMIKYFGQNISENDLSIATLYGH